MVGAVNHKKIAAGNINATWTKASHFLWLLLSTTYYCEDQKSHHSKSILNEKLSGFPKGRLLLVSYGPNHLKTITFKIWMFVSGFQALNKMGTYCPDFKWLDMQTICKPNSSTIRNPEASEFQIPTIFSKLFVVDMKNSWETTVRPHSQTLSCTLNIHKMSV